MNAKEYDKRLSELFKIELGKQLKAWREYRGLSQRELGRRASLNPEHISNVENGKHKIFAETLAHLYSELDIDLNEMYKTVLNEVHWLLELET